MYDLDLYRTDSQEVGIKKYDMNGYVVPEVAADLRGECEGVGEPGMVQACIGAPNGMADKVCGSAGVHRLEGEAFESLFQQMLYFSKGDSLAGEAHWL